MTKKLYAAALLLATLWACAPQKQSETTPDIIADGAVFTLPEGSAIAANIRTDTLRLRPVEATFTASGEVRPIPAAYAEIAVPYTGRITKSFVRLGQQVSKGAPLFQISSADYSEAARAYMEAKAENELARRNYE
ncbi:MAG: efflux RND transporter periplasmic adaptor subunit, partial [Muribaculaceae bacterium]|nr:efflux RND transporter periplasmic adaptor subunit [Muribaculaceae bacterium]